MKKRLFLSIILGLLTALLVACGGGNNAATNESVNNDSEPNNAANNNGGDKEIYVVATDNGYVPFEYIDEDSGDLIGFDIDLIKALAEEAGIDIEFEVLEFDGIVAGISSGKFDIAIAGMTITEDRMKSIDFTDPYYEAGLILAVTDENEDIKSIDDVDGKVVATRTGSTSETYLKKETDAEIEAFPQIIEGYQNVLAGRADAVLYDLPNVQFYSEKEADNKLITVGEKLTGEDYGIAFPKGSELRDKINDALKTLKEDGTYDDLYEEWFGERPEGT